MSDSEPENQADLGRHVVVAAVVVIVLAALIGPTLVILRSQRSSAAFGDVQSLGTNHLGTASLDLEVGQQSATLSATAMAPGDTVVGWLDLANTGELALRYAIETDNGDDLLMDWLRWDVWTTDDSCDGEPDPWDRLVDDASLGRGPGQPLLGDAQTGRDSGDRVLEPNDGERICLAATLPSDAPDSVQGRSVTQDLHVLAEHHLEDGE